MATKVEHLWRTRCRSRCRSLRANPMSRPTVTELRKDRYASILLASTALTLAGVGLATNAQFAASLGQTPVSSMLLAALGVATGAHPAATTALAALPSVVAGDPAGEMISAWSDGAVSATAVHRVRIAGLTVMPATAGLLLSFAWLAWPVRRKVSAGDR